MFHIKCLFVSPFVNELVKIFMQIFFVVAFLALFFFLYVVNVEKEIFESQINYLVDNIFNELSFTSNVILTTPMKSEINKEMLNYINSFQVTGNSYNDIRAENEQVINNTVNIVICFALLFIACLFSLYALHVCIDIPRHVVENLIVLGMVGLTEYLFLNLVTRNYMAADPNHVKLYFAEQLKIISQQKQEEQKQHQGQRQQKKQF